MYNELKKDKKRDFMYDFFDEYFLKYVAEIDGFDSKIIMNEEDTMRLLAAGQIVSDPGMYLENEVIKATKIYDSIAFFRSIGLLECDFKNSKFYINASILYQKAIEGENAKVKDANDTERKIVSVYKKRVS